MSRTKRTSPILEAARVRLAGLKSITPAPDFGPDLNIPVFEAQLAAVSAQLASYNQLLSTVDQELNALRDLETPLADKSTRLLSATKGKYGPDSSEYQQVGGTRTSHRKHPAAHAKKASPAAKEKAEPNGSVATT